jgi:hypothetical protein
MFPQKTTWTITIVRSGRALNVGSNGTVVRFEYQVTFLDDDDDVRRDLN